MQKTPKVLWYVLTSELIIFVIFVYIFINEITTLGIQPVLGNGNTFFLGILLELFSLVSIFLSIKYIKRCENITLPIIIIFVSILAIFSPVILFPIKTSLLPQLEAQAQQNKFHQQLKDGQDMMEKMNTLKDSRSKILTDDFKKPHKIINLIGMGQGATRQIGVLLDNNVEVPIIPIASEEKENTIVEELNNSKLQGVSVIASQFNFMPDWYTCENPDFSKNTCGKEIFFGGIDLVFFGNNKRLDQYIYCQSNYFPFLNSSSQGFDIKQYCAN